MTRLRWLVAAALLVLTAQAPPSSVLTAIDARTLPDTAHSVPAKGFTVTGLTMAPDGTVWASNDGRLRQDDGTPYRPSLVHLTRDLTTVLGEVPLPFDSSVQGLVVIGDRLWFALPSAQAIASVVMQGGGNPRIERHLPYGPNGLGYDPKRRALVVGSEVARTIAVYPLDGGPAVRTLTPADAPDQLLVTDRGLLMTSGANRQPGVLVLLRADGYVLHRWTLPGSQAIEGVLLRGREMIVANDAWYHKAGVELNQVMRYRRPAALRR